MDRFAHRASSPTGPAEHGFAITPDNANDLAEVTRAIYVGTGGTLVLRMRSGAEVTLANVPAGVVLPVRAMRVLAATTATDLVGLC